MFVFLIDVDVGAIRDELLGDQFTKIVMNVAESAVLIFNWILLKPFHRLINAVVLLLKILELKLLPENHFVEGSCEEGINKHSLS